MPAWLPRFVEEPGTLFPRCCVPIDAVPDCRFEELWPRTPGRLQRFIEMAESAISACNIIQRKGYAVLCANFFFDFQALLKILQGFVGLALKQKDLPDTVEYNCGHALIAGLLFSATLLMVFARRVIISLYGIDIPYIMQQR